KHELILRYADTRKPSHRVTGQATKPNTPTASHRENQSETRKWKMSQLVPQTMGGKMDYAQAKSGSNLLPKHLQGNPANILYAIEFAEALGMKPIHAITSVHVINGKPSASADLIGSMVRKAGYKLRVTGDETFAEAVLIRADDPDFEFKARWDLSKAKQAG